MTEPGQEKSPESFTQSGSDQSCEVKPKQQANAAVPIGAVLVIVAFFLPLVYLDSMGVSGFQLVIHKGLAWDLLVHFGIYVESPTGVTRPLILVPFMGLGVLLLELTIGKHVISRLVSRTLIFVTGVILAGGFGYVGAMCVEVLPAPGLWMMFSGGLLIALGSVFDVVRGT